MDNIQSILLILYGISLLTTGFFSFKFGRNFLKKKSRALQRLIELIEQEHPGLQVAVQFLVILIVGLIIIARAYTSEYAPEVNFWGALAAWFASHMVVAAWSFALAVGRDVFNV